MRVCAFFCNGPGPRPPSLVWVCVALCLLTMMPALIQGVALQRFDRQPTYTEVNPGEDARLTCTVLNKRGACSWQKDNKPVGLYERKYEWAGDRSGGDCSLWVRAAVLQFDDGLWECQVTASELSTQDALTSSPARLVVRVQPQHPRIEHNASAVPPGHAVSAPSGGALLLRCVSRYGNPPAALAWFLADRRLPSDAPQTNATEPDNPRTWQAASLLRLRVDKTMHRQPLRCLALHDLYPARSEAVAVLLDVTYAPETRVSGAPRGDVEEGRDAVELRCESDANPAARVSWRRQGSEREGEEAERGEDGVLRLSPASRSQSGVYQCVARNAMGSSPPLTVVVDVKYPPRVLDIGGANSVTSPLFSSLSLECRAEGNPAPALQWLRALPPNPSVEAGAAAAGAVAAEGGQLLLTNVTYAQQGEYVCRATNRIAGTERVAQSDKVTVRVVGPPQVLAPSALSPSPASASASASACPEVEVSVSSGSDAVLRLAACAEPRPVAAAWEWGSLRLDAGASQGRFGASELAPWGGVAGCYEAALRVGAATRGDARRYALWVRNDRGEHRAAVTLTVTEPLEMATVVSVAAGSLLVLLVVVLAILCAVRRRKCCFARRRGFGAAHAIDRSEKLQSARLGGLGGGGLGYLSPTLSAPAPAPATITISNQDPRGEDGSPEAMKVRLAAMVLQPPTRV